MAPAGMLLRGFVGVVNDDGWLILAVMDVVMSCESFGPEVGMADIYIDLSASAGWSGFGDGVRMIYLIWGTL